MTDKQIKKIISDHRVTAGRTYDRYERYYQGQNETIQDKEPQAEPDNRKALAYARKAVNTVVGYMFKPGNMTITVPGKNKAVA